MNPLKTRQTFVDCAPGELSANEQYHLRSISSPEDRTPNQPTIFPTNIYNYPLYFYSEWRIDSNLILSFPDRSKTNNVNTRALHQWSWASGLNPAWHTRLEELVYSSLEMFPLKGSLPMPKRNSEPAPFPPNKNRRIRCHRIISLLFSPTAGIPRHCKKTRRHLLTGRRGLPNRDRAAEVLQAERILNPRFCRV